MTANSQDLIDWMDESDESHVKIGLFDLDGLLRGKYMSAKKFRSALESGFGFCDVVLGWDMDDKLYDRATFTGWHTGYPDATARLIPHSARRLAFEERRLFCMAEFAGAAEALCPRGLLRRVIERGAAMEFSALAGFEYEFIVFDETPASVQEKGFAGLRRLAPGNFGYSVLRTFGAGAFYEAMLSGCTSLGIPLEGLHEETGPGVLEAAITVDEALAAADKAALFKTFAKVIAQQHGKMVTFMAKFDESSPGQGGHIHISLRYRDDVSPFFDQSAAHGISETMLSFIAGQQRLLPEFIALMAPTVNSFARLVPGYWAPTDANWGIENRTCALRAVVGSAAAQRVEFRVPGADANPYLALAAALAAGWTGIAEGWEPDLPITGNAYAERGPDARRLPATLAEAAARLRGSDQARQWFGDEFVEHFAFTRDWEESESRRQVSDWQRARYFERV